MSNEKKQAKNLNATRVGAGETKIRNVVVGSKHPIQPSPKYNTPKSFGKLVGK